MLYDKLLGSHQISSAEFIGALAFSALILCIAALLQFLTENAIRGDVLRAQQESNQQTAAAREHQIRYMEIAKEMGVNDLAQVEHGYATTVAAINATDKYFAGVAAAPEQGQS